MKSIQKRIQTLEQDIATIKNQQKKAWKREDTYSMQMLTDRLHLSEHKLTQLKLQRVQNERTTN